MTDTLKGQPPKCLETTLIPWKRQCPYELLLVEKQAPGAGKLELDSANKVNEIGKLKIPKDNRPRKAKSWASTPSPGAAKLSPSGTFPGHSLNTTVEVDTIELNETSYSNIELLTGV